MKKILIIMLAALSLVLMSCETTSASDIPDASRETTLEPSFGHDYTSDITYKFICDFAQELKGDEKSITVTKDDKSRTVTIEGYKLDVLVGPLAQDGIADITFTLKAEGNKATCTLHYIDSFGTVSIGPLQKKVSMGITTAGIDFYNVQIETLLNLFDGAMQGYSFQYAYENGWLDETIEQAQSTIDWLANLNGEAIKEDPTNYPQEYWEKFFPGYTFGYFYINENGTDKPYYWALSGHGSLDDWLVQPFNWNGWHKTAKGEIVNAAETLKITKESMESGFSSGCTYYTEPYKK